MKRANLSLRLHEKEPILELFKCIIFFQITEGNDV
jgi:hypothetical protein